MGYQAGMTAQKSGAIAIGYLAGSVGTTTTATTGQDVNAIAIGTSAGQTAQASGAIAIGYQAGSSGQGQFAIAIGQNAGQSGQAASTIVINAQGATAVTGATSNALYIAPIRNITQTTALGYNLTTSEITYYNMTGAGTVTALTANTTNTLTINFNSYFQGTSTTTVSSATSGTTTINNYAFSGAISGGQYTVVISITGTGATFNPTLTITPPGTPSSTIRFNFSSVSVTTAGSLTVSQTNPKYIVLTVSYDGTNYYISASGFNN